MLNLVLFNPSCKPGSGGAYLSFQYWGRGCGVVWSVGVGVRMWGRQEVSVGSLRSAWSTEWAPRQPGLYRKTLSWKPSSTQTKPKTTPLPPQTPNECKRKGMRGKGKGWAIACQSKLKLHSVWIISEERSCTMNPWIWFHGLSGRWGQIPIRNG